MTIIRKLLSRKFDLFVLKKAGLLALVLILVFPENISSDLKFNIKHSEKELRLELREQLKNEA